MNISTTFIKRPVASAAHNQIIVFCVFSHLPYCVMILLGRIHRDVKPCFHENIQYI